MKWAEGTDIANPVFNGVTIIETPVKVETDYVDFVGTYRPVGIYTDKKTNLYLGADNKLYYPTATDFTVNAFRAYFQLKQGLTAGETNSMSAGVRAFVLNFGDGETTSISEELRVKNLLLLLDGTPSMVASSMASRRRRESISTTGVKL